MNDAPTTAEGVTKPVTLPLLTNVDAEAGYVQPRISWPRETTAPALEPAWAGEFRSFDDWVSFASKRLTEAGRTDTTYVSDIPAVCIDAKGRRCINGGHFAKARDEDAFPVRFFWDMRPADRGVTVPLEHLELALALIDDMSRFVGVGKGWAADVRRVWRNALYVVLVRPFVGPGGEIMLHLAIRTPSSAEPPWRDLQRIKNEICGEPCFAVQVYPAQSRLIDEADMYHLWVYGQGHEPGFGLHPEDRRP